MDKEKNLFKTTKITRRDLLKSLMAMGVISFTGFDLAWASNKESIIKRKIPSTGELISAVGLGTSDEFESGEVESLDPLREVLRLFVAMGGEVIDTAPIYGDAETIIGKLIKELEIAEKLFVATKVRTKGKNTGLKSMQNSEKLLGVKPLDLIEVHSLVDAKTQLKNLRQWKKEGKVRYIGITHHHTSAHKEIIELMKNEKPDFVQVNYSVTEPEAENKLLPLAAEKKIAVMVNRPFMNGELFRITKSKPLPKWASKFDCNSWAQFSLKYILSNPAVTCVIPATSDPKHLVDNMGAGMGRLPDEKTRKLMKEYMKAL